MRKNKKSDLLNKFPNLKKTVFFLLNSQNNDGSYSTLKPDPVSSMYFLGILNELNKRPKFRTTCEWVKSLQTDHRGFGETTGENSWDYTTYWGSEMHKFLKIKPLFKKDFVNFVQSHQNSDGGFGAAIGAQSNLDSTIYWSISLIDLGFEVKNEIALTNFLNSFLMRYINLSLWHIHKIIYILTKLKYEINFKGRIINYLEKYISSNKFSIDLENLYYAFSTFRMLGSEKQIDKDFILKCQNSNGGFGRTPYSMSELSSTYFAVKLLKMMNIFTDYLKNKVIEYTLEKELEKIGFVNEMEKSTHALYCCVSALNILGYEPRYLDKLLLWLKYCQNLDGGFGYSPNSQSIEKSTYWSLSVLKILDKIDMIDKGNLMNYLKSNIMNINPFTSYYLVCTYEILGIIPPHHNKIAEELLTYQNIDGGFTGIKNTSSEMYECFRAVNAISSIQNISEINKIGHSNWISKIRKDVVDWILSCENKSGGFSWTPNEIPYIQSTYHALTILDILKKKVINPKLHTDWILQFQNNGGGFNGGVKRTPSDVHFTFWALESLHILTKMMGCLNYV